MIRKLKSNRTKIDLILGINGVSLSPLEKNVFEGISLFETNGSLTITPSISQQIRNSYGVSQSAFNTAIYRLLEKKVIRKDGKTILLSPAYVNLNEIKGVYIEFQSNEPSGIEG